MLRLLIPVLLVLGFAIDASADAAPPEMRQVEYQFSIANQDAYPEYVFIVFPTSNNGYAYVVEKGKGLTNLMMRAGSKTGPTGLYAMKKADFAEWQPEPHRYAHGDKDAVVSVVPQPPERALKASKTIEPPGLLPKSSPVRAIQRRFQIVKLTDTAFELALAQERTAFKDGTEQVKDFSIAGAK